MNCNIIKDLIPLCSEGLCSEESEKQIKEHIRDCEKCRMLYEHAPQNSEGDTPKAETPPEKNLFKKVNKKLKRHRIVDIILLLIIAGIICILGWLTYGQITKNHGCQSFETIFQSIEVKKLGGYIADGDFKSYMNNITNGHVGDLYTANKIDYIRQNDIRLLEETFEKAYGDTEVKDIKVKSEYVDMLAEESVAIYSTLTITFENGKEFSADFVKDVDGLYRGYGGYSLSEENFTAEMEFDNAIEFTSWHEAYPLGLVEALMIKNNSTSNLLLNKFHIEDWDGMRNGRDSLLEKGFVMNNCFFSRYRFDEEKNMFYYEASLDASDSQGTAQLRTRIYYDHTGMLAPEKDTIEIYTNGCTPELQEALRNFFG